MPYFTRRFAPRVALALTAGILAGCLADEKPGGSASAQFSGSNANFNNPPEISGVPRTVVKIGEVYVFAPEASDPDGDRLSFSIENRPRWADFDSGTGRLSGQVLLGDEGVYSNIRISVSDGSTSRSLSTFSITVTNSALGAMTLNWTPPAENTDGSVLTDLAGYNIYFGSVSGRYTNHVRVRNPSVNSLVIENLLAGTYYVVATAYNSRGSESRFSNEVVKTVTAD